MSRKLKGGGFDDIPGNIPLYGKYDPDAPPVGPKKLKPMVDQIRPKIGGKHKPIGRLIIAGNGGAHA